MVSTKNIDAVLNSRRSIRKFSPSLVPKEDIDEIVAAGLLAPTASNRQHWQVVAVTEKQTITALHEVVGAQDIVYNPPVVLTVLYNPLFNISRAANIQSTAAAVTNMLLKATSKGYGTTWVAGVGDDDELKKLLNIPKEMEPLCYVLLGKVLEEFPPPPAKPELPEVLFYDQYKHNQIDLPNSIRPGRCTWDQIANHQKYLCRSSYLGKDYDYVDKREKDIVLERVWDIIGNKRKRVVSFFAYDGSVLRAIDSIANTHEVFDIELSDAARDFVQFKCPNVIYRVGREYTDLEDGSVDTCLCLFSLEKLPDYTIVLKEANRLMNENGKLIIFFRNKRSIYGLIYFLVEKVLGVKSISAVFPLSPGPFEPIDPSRLLANLRTNGFEVEKSQGLFFVPAEVFLFSEKIDGYLKRHGKGLTFLKVLVKPTIRFLKSLFFSTESFKSFQYCSSCYVSAIKRK